MEELLSNPWVVIPLRIIIVLGFVLTAVPGLVWLERRVLALMQIRKGPNRVGPAGLLQPVADGIKLFFKEDVLPERVDRFIYFLAPAGFLIPVLCATAVVPWGPDDRLTPIADVNIGILFLLAMTSLTVYGIVLAGWSSNNKYSLLGGLRASAQTISYELGMGLSIIAVVLMSGSLSMRDIVANQQGDWGMLHWHLFRFFPLGLIATGIFLVSMLAETNRAPFDLPEAESELIAGYHTEYSSMKFAMFFMGEYASMITISAVMVTLFFGGWLSPLPFAPFTWIPGPVWFLLKLGVFIYFFIWVRATLPRLRYDMLMKLGWLRLLPTALVNLFLVAMILWWQK
ncbi:MAG: NADH-quinone oxidoreductase subunit H [Armatimonadota bacterium]|nr:MAG: NADH-quinone oxidoreductase subunit H [Armatimonadota bacterium]